MRQSLNNQDDIKDQIQILKTLYFSLPNSCTFFFSFIIFSNNIALTSQKQCYFALRLMRSCGFFGASGS